MKKDKQQQAIDIFLDFMCKDLGASDSMKMKCLADTDLEDFKKFIINYLYDHATIFTIEENVNELLCDKTFVQKATIKGIKITSNSNILIDVNWCWDYDEEKKRDIISFRFYRYRLKHYTYSL